MNNIESSEEDFRSFACEGDIKAMISMLNKGIDVNAAASYGFTALYHAVEFGRLGMVKMLIERGASVNVKISAEHDDGGSTPLHIAAKSDDIELVELLLQHGAEMEAKDRWGETPLMGAIDAHHYLNDDTIRYLISRGANLQVSIEPGYSLLEKTRREGSKEIYKYICGLIPPFG